MAFLINVPDKNRTFLHYYFFVPVGVGINMVKLWEFPVSCHFENVNSFICIQDIHHTAIDVHVLRKQPLPFERADDLHLATPIFWFRNKINCFMPFEAKQVSISPMI